MNDIIKKVEYMMSNSDWSSDEKETINDTLKQFSKMVTEGKKKKIIIQKYINQN